MVYNINRKVGKIMNKENELTIQFKKYDSKIWEVWTDNEDGGDYIRSITSDDICVLCAEVESENDIVNMSPLDFISMVWDLCSYKIFDNFDDFDFYSSKILTQEIEFSPCF
jgi:hypothetical protein